MNIELMTIKEVKSMGYKAPPVQDFEDLYDRIESEREKISDEDEKDRLWDKMEAVNEIIQHLYEL